MGFFLTQIFKYWLEFDLVFFYVFLIVYSDNDGTVLARYAPVLDACDKVQTTGGRICH